MCHNYNLINISLFYNETKYLFKDVNILCWGVLYCEPMAPYMNSLIKHAKLEII